MQLLEPGTLCCHSHLNPLLSSNLKLQVGTPAMVLTHEGNSLTHTREKKIRIFLVDGIQFLTLMNLDQNQLLTYRKHPQLSI